MKIAYTSPRTTGVLKLIGDGPEGVGSTPDSSLAFILWWAIEHRVQRILQLGTLVGYSAIALADVISPASGRVITVDPDDRKNLLAVNYARQAGLAHAIDFITGRSQDASVRTELERRGPFDLIYIDASHAKEETLVELGYYTRPPFFSPTTTLFLHDTSLMAQSADPTRRGGVRAALETWERAADRHTVYWLEPPLWPDPWGLAIVTGMG